LSIRYAESFDIGIGDLDLCVSLKNEKEADILVIEVENRAIVLAYSTQVVLLDEEINDCIHG